MREVTVVVDADHLGAIDTVVAALVARGLRVAAVHRALGIVSGYAPAAVCRALADVSGVEAVDCAIT